MDRRQFGRAATMTAFTVSAAGSIGTASADLIKVGQPHITQIESLTERLWEHDNRFGGGKIARYAYQQYRFVRSLLNRGECGPRTESELMSAAGHLSICAGWLAYDCNEPALTRTCYTDAVLLAEANSDSDLRSSAIGALGLIAIDRPTKSREGVGLTQRAAELSRRVPSPRLNSLRNAREAIAHAAVGDSREFSRGMTCTWREADRGLDDADDPNWLLFVTPAELRVHEAKGHMLLGQHSKAADLYRESVNRPGNLPRDDASYRTYYAASLAGLGDTTSAVEAANSALALLENTVNSPRLLAELQPVYTAARHLTSDDATHFRHRYASLVGRPKRL
ncbi:hypothetical protein [Nocardia cyriacigeorgica]|uniref:hypothetical protein n=1 Tax=Nocardia cyriacigeorgica TaxID=135487 RepID=UPI0024537E71|nr:hypothetical protein [Nocardia cyriacigeorgica]